MANETGPGSGENLKSRRDFFKTTGQAVAASAIAGTAIPYIQVREPVNPVFSDVDGATRLLPDQKTMLRSQTSKPLYSKIPGFLSKFQLMPG